MKRLLLSGIIYLIGVACVLALKPALMFREDGIWKEFGIGRNRGTHTWFPFWLFVVIWAIVSYLIAFLVIPGEGSMVASNNSVSPKRGKRNASLSAQQPAQDGRPVPVSPQELTPGYYVLNTDGSKDGVPRYIYIGAAPEPINRVE